MIAASTSKASTGCRVTSAARRGVLQISKIVWSRRKARYSAMYRPAWRMNHTGVQSPDSPAHARRNRWRIVLVYQSSS